MELEGLKRAVKKINEYGVEIGTLITDRHQQNKQMASRDASRYKTLL